MYIRYAPEELLALSNLKFPHHHIVKVEHVCPPSARALAPITLDNECIAWMLNACSNLASALSLTATVNINRIQPPSTDSWTSPYPITLSVNWVVFTRYRTRLEPVGVYVSARCEKFSAAARGRVWVVRGERFHQKQSTPRQLGTLDPHVFFTEYIVCRWLNYLSTDTQVGFFNRR